MKILITHSIPEPGLSMLRERDISFHELSSGNTILKKSALIRALRKEPYDGMITMLTDTIDTEVFGVVGSQMKIIANYAVGFNNIDIATAKERDIVITNTPGVLTNTVAEHTFGLILAAATRIVEADAFVRAKKFTGWQPDLFLGFDLMGKTLGILGAGRIGSRVAELGMGFGMKIIYHDMRKNEDLEEKTGAVFSQGPEDVLREADVVSVHLPLNEQTHHFLDMRRLSFMKDSAILVNTSRGSVIDEEALTNALKERNIFAAALDVFEEEPSVSRALRSLPNVILTPHIASASVETRNKMAKIAAENIVAVLHGEKPTHQVG